MDKSTGVDKADVRASLRLVSRYVSLVSDVDLNILAADAERAGIVSTFSLLAFLRTMPPAHAPELVEGWCDELRELVDRSFFSHALSVVELEVARRARRARRARPQRKAVAPNPHLQETAP